METFFIYLFTHYWDFVFYAHQKGTLEIEVKTSDVVEEFYRETGMGV